MVSLAIGVYLKEKKVFHTDNCLRRKKKKRPAELSADESITFLTAHVFVPVSHFEAEATISRRFSK